MLVDANHTYIHSRTSVRSLNILIEIMAILLFFPLTVVVTKSLKEQETKWRRILSPLSVSFHQVTPKCRAALTVCCFSSGDGSPPRRETDPPGIISEIFCAVLSALIPLDVSFFFLLARRCGLCYASAKPNRPRNGGVCQNTQRKMFWKGTSHKVGTRSYGKTWSGGPPRCRESPLSAWETGQKELPARVQIVFCFLQRQKKTQCGAVTYGAARSILASDSSASFDSLLVGGGAAEIFCSLLLLWCGGPFVERSRRGPSPSLATVVFSDNPFRRALCCAASIPQAYLARRMRSAHARSYRCCETSLSGFPPTCFSARRNLLQPRHSHRSVGCGNKDPNWVGLEFLTPDNLAPQVETFSETHLFTLCFLCLFFP